METLIVRMQTKESALGSPVTASYFKQGNIITYCSNIYIIPIINFLISKNLNLKYTVLSIPRNATCRVTEAYKFVVQFNKTNKQKQTPWSESASELY
jgi:hypothetical protein